MDVGASNAVPTGHSIRAFRLAAAAVLVVAMLALPAVGNARRGANLQLLVTFTATGLVTVTLPDGTPVGSTSGGATVIPAGYYTLVLYGPGECINLPLFQLAGPGVNIADDMRGGEVERSELVATFLPNSTYTWHLDKSQSIVHTFRTASEVLGTASGSTSSGSSGSSSSSSKATAQDIVGSSILPFRGTLAGAVSAAGRLTFSYRGKNVTHLKPGRYTVSVVDRSSTNGFLLEKLRHRATTVSGAAFVGKRRATVSLTTGQWFVLQQPGKKTYSLSVA